VRFGATEEQARKEGGAKKERLDNNYVFGSHKSAEKGGTF
jgi:hypothetical protein